MTITSTYSALRTINKILDGKRVSSFVRGYAILDAGTSDHRIIALVHRTLAHHASSVKGE